MKIKVRIHPNSSQEKIEKSSEDMYEVWLKEKPVEGKANARLLKLLKKNLKSNLRIVSGLKSRNKIIEVLD